MCSEYFTQSAGHFQLSIISVLDFKVSMTITCGHQYRISGSSEQHFAANTSFCLSLCTIARFLSVTMQNPDVN